MLLFAGNGPQLINFLVHLISGVPLSEIAIRLDDGSQLRTSSR
jgi:hypothetical protein